MRNSINATPIDFQTGDWKSLWEELKGVFDFWIEQGVKIFRVDDPHTKSLRFWAWYIPEIRRHHPDVIFLSEAFTRPRVMYHLAKLGFTQSYTYFAWRNHAWEPALDLDARSLLLGSPPGGHPDPCSTCAREGQACNVSVPPGP